MFFNHTLTRIGRLVVVFTIALSLLLGTAVPPGMAQDLPLSEPDFQGHIDKINKTYVYSEPDPDILSSPTALPTDAPNVVLIMLDDVGFGASETFGGPVHTPTLEKLAADGLSYNRFHTTALCSPTRAGLLTGRNHHSAATGAITDVSTGFPGYTGLIPQSTATVAQILQDHGYKTAWLGKNHNLPAEQSSNAGPFTRWPNDLGFDYFYGFLGGGGETDQWYPALYENRNPINQPSYPNEEDLDNSYNLTRDLADKAINWVSYNHSLSPDTPFFLYFAPGATHAPHQPPPSYTQKYQARGEHAIAAGVEHRGMFTEGWDELHDEICTNEKDMGIIPQDAECTERPEEIPAWDNSDFNYPNDEYRDLMALQMQNYAGFLEYTDEQVGRVLEAIDDLGEKDNTIVIYIVGDNGASAEGGLMGGCNMSATYAGLDFTKEENLKCQEELGWGNPGTTPHYAVGWAWALDAPFRWTKQIASYFGGTRNPMVVSWPGHINVEEDRTANLRDQFLHVIDVTPTILDLVGIEPPEYVNGIEQKPMEGASFVNTFGSDGANAIPLRDTQYFEMFANRGIYHDGWMASSFHGQLPWDIFAKSTLKDNPELEDEWELFDLEKDFAQNTNLATQYPDKLEEMKALFDREAEKYNVYPIDDRFGGRANLPRPTVWEDRTKFEFYPGAVFLPGDVAPNIAADDNLGYIITANLNITDKENVQGVILASGGGDTGGYSLYVNEDNYPVFEYKYLNRTRKAIVSDERLKDGLNQVSFSFNFDPEEFKESKDFKRIGSGYLCVNGQKFDSDESWEILNGNFNMDSQDVGMDLRAPVSKNYEPPFEFTDGEIKKVTIDIAPSEEELASAQSCVLDIALNEEELTSSEKPASGDNLIPEELTERIIEEILERLEK
ncbi:arylsulfatase [Okeania sp. SIO2C9]|uniref:arylsulfatase n=1 Tax=Okeania sp. SIO2C9 TaxID=2607791 RepID=UPI0025D72E0D|nr:arylsulfatase [Okeania sp. SIO2C9]